MQGTRQITAALALGCALFLLGCKGQSDTSRAAPNEDIGIEACDSYFKKVSACLSKVPPELKAPMENALKANRQTWREVAKNAATRDNLKAGCQATLDAFVSANPSCN